MGKLPSPDPQLESISVFNTFNPCVLNDDVVLKLIVVGTVLDPRNAFTIIDKSAKDVVAKVLNPKGALKTNGNLFTVVDAQVLLPLGKPSITVAIILANELRDSEPCSGCLYSLAA